MRIARLMGLSPDGRFLIVAADRGEELAIAADDRLRAALRGDRPRLGQLEIEMESALTPREIQNRIRAGESLEDVARVAGIDTARVERFATPVLAERDHVARLAMSSSVRRRGETSGHRNLRGVLNERLQSRNVGIDTVRWDSHRLADGRWAVTADYRSGDTDRQAVFLFDVPGRFSVAGNDDARWVLGDQSSSRGPQPGRRRPETGESDADGEPTLDLSDELALVRVVQEPPDTAADGPVVAEPEASVPDAEVAQVRTLRAVPEPPAEPEAEESAIVEESAEPSQLDALYDMLDGPDVEPAQPPESARGPSDAAAVPATPMIAPGGWEPAIVLNYPVEPAPATDDQVEDGGTDEPGPPDLPTNIDDREDEVHAFDESHDAAPHEPAAESEPEPTAEPAPEPEVRPSRRKRASVPSWDEIMFGGPKKP